MAVTNKWYGNAFKAAFNKEVDFNSDTVKAALVTSSYAFDQDVHDYFNDITNEVTGTGYTAGGATVGSCTVAYDGASNTLTLDATDVSWASSTITARGLVLYVSTGTGSTSPLLCFVDFGADVSTTAGTFLVQWNASGIATVTVS